MTVILFVVGSTTKTGKEGNKVNNRVVIFVLRF